MIGHGKLQGMTKNRTDFILSSDWKIVRNCEVVSKVDIGSDHRMVRARAEMDKKLMRLKKIQIQKPLRLDLRVLEKWSIPFGTELKNRFDILKDEEPSIDKTNAILRESVDTIQNKTQKSTIKKSIEDTEIESLNKKRKELRQKNKQDTKRQGRICRMQQMSEEEA